MNHVRTGWDPVVFDGPETPAKAFAMALEAELAAGMRRLRLGGTDTRMVFQRAWNATAKKRLAKKLDVGVGLGTLCEFHPYGEYINFRKVVDRLELTEDDNVCPRMLWGMLDKVIGDETVVFCGVL